MMLPGTLQYLDQYQTQTLNQLGFLLINHISARFSILKRYLLTTWNLGIGPETLLALNNHSNSLKALKLNGLKSAAVKNLSLLQGCGVLEILDIQDSDGFVNLEETENDIFLEVVEWLGRCDRLRDLSFKNFLSAPSILTDICFRDNIRLRKLEVVDQYSLASNQTFHQAIAQQKSLETLILRGDPEGSFRDDIDTVISAISQLSGLKELDLLNTSEYFKSAEIRQIASSLRGLEKLTIAGFDVTDEIWPSMAGLHHLRALNSHGLSSFSCDGLLNFISTLRPSNHGLVLSVWNQRFVSHYSVLFHEYSSTECP
jgi:hypothetical protein